MIRRTATLVALLALLSVGGTAAAAPRTDPQTMLILPVTLTDTSGEVDDQSAAHARRTRLVVTELAAALPAAGALKPEIVDQATLDRACPAAASDCVLALAKARGATRILVVEAFKTSSLILELRVLLVDASVNRTLLRRFVSFRSDDDAAWARAARFVAGQIAMPS